MKKTCFCNLGKVLLNRKTTRKKKEKKKERKIWSEESKEKERQNEEQDGRRFQQYEESKVCLVARIILDTITIYMCNIL